MKCDKLQQVENPIEWGLYYDKNEVDSAIDELKREHHKERDEYIDWVNRLQKENAEFKAVIVELKDIDSKNRSAYYKDLAMMAKDVEHQKYKRCLAMAKWCFTKSNYHFVLARHGEDAKKNNRKSILYSKWHKRWLKLAEKYKEGNV